MTYLLDSNTLSYLLQRRSPVGDRYEETLLREDEIILCSFVHYEIVRYLRLKGSTSREREYNQVVSRWRYVGFDDKDWDTAADLWAERHRLGRPITDSDLLIAVCARKSGATLVTNNTRHFDGLGVALENWT